MTSIYQAKRPRRRREPREEDRASDAKDDLSRVLRMAESEDVVITRHGKPAGVLIGFPATRQSILLRVGCVAGALSENESGQTLATDTFSRGPACCDMSGLTYSTD